MLEDALKSSSLSKDVGWRRSSREAGSLQGVPSSSPVTATTPTSQPQSQRTSVDEQGALESPNSDRGSRASSPAPTATQNDTRFFRFRLTGSGRSTPTLPPAHSPPSTPRPPPRLPHTTVGHLTSASLPSLVASTSPTIASELEDLRGQLLSEKRKSEKIAHEKKELESELESLSQALFEEVRAHRLLFHSRPPPPPSANPTHLLGEQDGGGGAHQARRG